MIKVHGRATSSNVQLVMWAIGELKLEHQRLDAGLSLQPSDSAEFLTMNPNGLVPVLEEGRLILFESAAILRYLAACHGDQDFWPSDPAKRAELDVWAEWTKSTLYPVLQGGIFLPLVRQNPATVNKEALQDAVQKLKALAGILDARIDAGPWLGGDVFTFADVMTGHLLYRYYDLDFDRAELPNLAAYYERLKQRPAFAEHVMVSYEPLRWQ